MLGVLGVLVLALAGCSTGESAEDVDDDTDDSVMASDSVDAEDETPVSSDDGAGTTESTTTTVVTQSVEDAWATIWSSLVADGREGLVRSGLVGDAAVEAFVGLDLLDATEAENYPRLEVVSGATGEGGVVQVTDCVLFDTRSPIWLTATLGRESAEDDWMASDVEVIDATGGCVPKEVSDAAIAGAQAFWDAKREFTSPANPDHPLLAATTTGEYQDLLEDLLRRLQVDNVYADFGQTELNFGVSTLESNSIVRIENCHIPDADLGWFTPDGNHVDGSAPVVPGQTDFEQLTMTREPDGDEYVWRVSQSAGSYDDGCDPDSTAEFLAVH